ncbi:SDR family oxidoreductase [Streptomyces sp. NPDC054813]
MTTGKLQGKVAVVTGGTTGIGLATARLFAKEGAYVFITGRRQKELDEAVKAIGGNVSGVQGDVTELTDLDRLYASVEAKGRIDIVFANAGLGELVSLEDVTEEIFDKIFNVNVKGALFTVQKALPLLNDGASITLLLAATRAHDAFAQITSTIPMGRLGEPDEVAKAALFLASDDSSFVTGIELFVDGGRAQI